MVTTNIGLSLLLFVLAAGLRFILSGHVWTRQPGWAWPLLFAISLFLGLSWLYGITLESFLKPRWLAHNVREFATFPLTAFPWCFALLYYLESKIYQGDDRYNRFRHQKGLLSVGLLFIVICLFFGWHVVRVLSEGIGSMAQKPSFAQDGGLSILYLLSFHYFEHALDYVFILLLAFFIYSSLILMNLSRSRDRSATNLIDKSKVNLVQGER